MIIGWCVHTAQAFVFVVYKWKTYTRQATAHRFDNNIKRNIYVVVVHAYAMYALPWFNTQLADFMCRICRFLSGEW